MPKRRARSKKLERRLREEAELRLLEEDERLAGVRGGGELAGRGLEQDDPATLLLTEVEAGDQVLHLAHGLLVAVERVPGALEGGLADGRLVFGPGGARVRHRRRVDRVGLVLALAPQQAVLLVEKVFLGPSRSRGN